MTEKRFSFGVDIPMSWKQKTLKNERRFSDLEGFLDEDYDGEHHMLWDNQKEKWCHLDDALSVMEEEYYSTKNENEQLKQRNENQYQQLNKLWKLIEKGDWETLTAMDKKMKEDEERLQREWKCYE